MLILNIISFIYNGSMSRPQRIILSYKEMTGPGLSPMEGLFLRSRRLLMIPELLLNKVMIIESELLMPQASLDGQMFCKWTCQ